MCRPIFLFSKVLENLYLLQQCNINLCRPCITLLSAFHLNVCNTVILLKESFILSYFVAVMTV